MSEAERAASIYKSHHWGLPPQRRIDLGPSRVFPDEMPQMGELIRVLIEGIEEGPVGEPGQAVEVDLPQGTHLAFGLQRPRRLYVVFESPELGRDVARAFWRPGAPSAPLQQINDQVRGRWKHRAFSRPAARNLQVQPVGWLLEVWYQSEKGKDGPSTYHHIMGEETNQPPMLCVDSTGSLWLAGGNYKVEPRGVVD